ncbi:MAG: GNAT family N-acetyltransferase [Spirochaetes bacterium]|nr:GNAT family N-acetyltransferase [Spirochaetota bacterium]
MSWFQVRRKHKKSLLKFILHNEWAHVPFSERIRNSQHGTTVIAYNGNSAGGSRKTDPENHQISSAILFSQYGIMFPIFNKSYIKLNREIETYIRRFRMNIYSVMGTKSDVMTALGLLERHPNIEIDYYLMALDSDDFFKSHGTLPGNSSPYLQEPFRELNINRAALRDAKHLFPLQEKYELEEVILDPKNFNPKFSLELLRKNLTRNIILFAEKNNIPIAKAGTNARGFNTDQIGGVFTMRAERGKGIAGQVMIKLLEYIFKEKKTASLFVKKENEPAVKLYKNLGFNIKDDFRIVYF